MATKKVCPTCKRPFYDNKREGPGDTVCRCPKCDHSVNKSDNFCRYCGATLRKEHKHD